MTTFNVDSVAQLKSALASAHGGDTILLASGTYSGLGELTGLNYTSNVTIASANAANQAVVTPFGLDHSSNITFSHIDFAAGTSTAYYDYSVSNTTNVSFDHDEFSGHVGAAYISSEPSTGMYLSTNSHISVTNSDFSYFLTGISNTAATGAVFSNNSFHELAAEGIQSTSSTNEQINNNVFTDLQPGPGYHSDGIQLWGAGTNGVTISGNLYVRGAGEPNQGISVGDGTSGWAHNVTIENNIVVGAGYGAIVTNNIDGLNVSGNTVAAYSDYPAWIYLQNTNGLTENNNTSFEFGVSTTNTNVTQSGNVTKAVAVTDGGAALTKTWLAEHPGWTGPFPASLAHLVGSTGTVVGPTPPTSSPPPATSVNAESVAHSTADSVVLPHFSAHAHDFI